MRLHPVFEIGILGFQIVEHIGIIDFGIALILQPEIRVLHRDSVALVTIGALLGDGRLRRCLGLAIRHGFLGKERLGRKQERRHGGERDESARH